jgi:hypothetical protein
MDVLERDGVAAGGAHAERVPVVVHDNADGGRRDRRVAVELAATVVEVADRRVE